LSGDLSLPAADWSDGALASAWRKEPPRARLVYRSKWFGMATPPEILAPNFEGVTRNDKIPLCRHFWRAEVLNPWQNFGMVS
jgi:hypothetical protein